MNPIWISFHECVPRTPTAKTKTWGVTVKYGGAVLGAVKWFGRWRRYAFFPEPASVYEPTCLRDIAAFCEEQTKAHGRARLIARATESVLNEGRR